MATPASHSEGDVKRGSLEGEIEFLKRLSRRVTDMTDKNLFDVYINKSPSASVREDLINIRTNMETIIMSNDDIRREILFLIKDRDDILSGRERKIRRKRGVVTMK